jgi:metal-responsive CopG/Arc/MetJ family transcriptional regulator
VWRGGAMAICVNINPKLLSELNALVDGKRYQSRDEAVEEAIRFLIAIKGKYYTRPEIKEVLDTYSTDTSIELLKAIKEEEEL